MEKWENGWWYWYINILWIVYKILLNNVYQNKGDKIYFYVKEEMIYGWQIKYGWKLKIWLNNVAEYIYIHIRDWNSQKITFHTHFCRVTNDMIRIFSSTITNFIV